VIDLYKFFCAQFSINLLNRPIDAGSEGGKQSLSPKLSTVHVDGWLSHNWRTQKFSGVLALFTIIQAAGWPIWPLLICSVVALALVIERMMSLRTHLVAPEGLLEQALKASQNNLPSEEAMQQLHDNSVLGRVLASGLHAMKDEPLISAEDLRSSMESAGRKAAHELEKYLVALATIASAAPLLGLLGTVIGMIDIFGSQAPGTSNPVQLAQGISIALYNTAFGLIIAIPALMFWRYLRGRVDAYVLGLELDAERFVRHLLAMRARLK
jgi:biopolymer transport protein ExbB